MLGVVAHAISDALLQPLQILLDIPLFFQHKHGDGIEYQKSSIHHALRD